MGVSVKKVSSASGPNVVAIVPAAGRSARFGRMKLLADLDGQPLVVRTIHSLSEAGIQRVIIVVAPQPFGTLELFKDSRVSFVTNPDPSRGMFSSIQEGLLAAAGTALVLPADMPFVTASTVAAVRDMCLETERVVVPLFQGRGGHPVALPSAVVLALRRAAPSSNLKEELGRLSISPVRLPVNDSGVLRDVDVPEDLSRGSR
jgi:molybdenum cofactor cytidylyltransferase